MIEEKSMPEVISEIICILQQYEILKEFAKGNSEGKKWFNLAEIKHQLAESKDVRLSRQCFSSSFDLILLDFLEQKLIIDRMYKISHTYLDLFAEPICITAKGLKKLTDLGEIIDEMYNKIIY